MKKILSTAVVLAAISTNAFAFGNNNNNTTTNNIPTANAGAIAGAGAQSGAKAKAKQQQGQGQEQGQGQQQGQGQIGINKSKNKNSNDLTSKNKNKNQNDLSSKVKTKVKTDVTNKSKNELNNKNKSKSTSNSSSGVLASGNSANLNAAKTSGEVNNAIGGDTTIVEGDSTVYEAPDIPVNTAIAPELVATSDCLGSISAGGQGQFLGLTFGKTTQSNPCNVRENAKITKAFFPKDIVLQKAVMCQNDIYKEAFKVTGDYHKVCVGAKEKSKSEYFGLVSTRAYEDVCKYPTADCKRFKKMGY